MLLPFGSSSLSIDTRFTMLLGKGSYCSPFSNIGRWYDPLRKVFLPTSASSVVSLGTCGNTIPIILC